MTEIEKIIQELNDTLLDLQSNLNHVFETLDSLTDELALSKGRFRKEGDL